MLILGEDEQKQRTVSIRIDRKGEPRSGEQCKDVPLNEFLENLSEEISSKSKDLSLVK
jgi:threonyl-tRNA synthetase